MAIVTITDANFTEEVVKSDKKVLIDFWASWCGPCKMLSPIIDEIAAERDDIKVCKINVDDEEELAAAFNVRSIPMLVIMENGQSSRLLIGLQSKEEVLAFIDQ